MLVTFPFTKECTTPSIHIGASEPGAATARGSDGGWTRQNRRQANARLQLPCECLLDEFARAGILVISESASSIVRSRNTVERVSAECRMSWAGACFDAGFDGRIRAPRFQTSRCVIDYDPAPEVTSRKAAWGHTCLHLAPSSLYHERGTALVIARTGA